MTWSFYEKGTGRVVARTYAGPREWLEANTRDGHVAYEGNLDPLSQKIDISREVRDADGALVKHGPVVDYHQPQPSAEHEWNADIKRWVLGAAASRKREILSQIKAIEDSGSHVRALREALLGRGGFDRLREIDDQIAELRKQL